MRTLASALTLACLSAPAPADASPLCRWVGPCFYLSPGFQLTVVDAGTGQPLSDVYAWVEWVQYGAHGIGGPLMVQDAVSGADGRLGFPRWGPRLGSRGGLVLGLDPAVVLFKPGYATLLVQNAVALGAGQHAAVRGFSRDGTTVELHRFRGASAQWIGELRRLVHPALSSYVSKASLDRFRALYLNRLRRVEADLARLPSDTDGADAFRSSLQLDRKTLMGGHP
jgi:hypothetical protein